MNYIFLLWLVCSLQRIARKWRASNYKRTQLSVFLAVRTPIRMLRQICIKKLRTAHVRKTHANASTCSQRTRGDALCCKKESCRQFGRDIGGIKRRYKQEAPEDTRRYQHSLEDTRRHQKAPRRHQKAPRRHQKAPVGTRRH